MEDREIILLYRIQQLFLTLINQVMKTVLISLQHVATLSTASIMIYFAIKFDSVISETGFIGWVVVLGAVAVPFVVEFNEAIMLSALADVSEGFVGSGKKMVMRNTYYYKFLRSCPLFILHEAYPFYTVDKSTFLDFCAQVVDYTITLLLW